MRRVKMAIAATALVGATMFAGATPAHAATSLRGVVYDYSECVRIGNYGIQNYGWTGPLQCVWNSTGNGSGLWFIYA
ncbi:hypothetical protein Cs7R123_05380 [Catellatospora sp. TT07R-123]|uniref:hypothetical protein n=1 Tax=Catellatospora sp. TT07R-123 TaxID=2733863 RepID=UPI001B214187|nr:hypothetical protein [Catellatospora sp. TT07R-123]GHJ43196.1 hypothetical protein Cs7R123_05380 [Catellatospora sp. TT07R-123]